jgi:hypothetical protein
MPAKISFFDMSILAIPSGPYIPLPVTLGPNWQPNDLRIFLQIAGGANPPTGTVTPPGFTAIATASAASGGGGGITSQVANISYRRLIAGDTDTFIQYAVPSSTSYSSLALVTARGASPSTNPTAAYVTDPSGAITLPGSSSTGGSVTVPSLSVPFVGVLLQLFFSYVAAGSACSLGGPTGWTNLVASDNSGATYSPWSGVASTTVVAKAFSSTGSTGSMPGLLYGAENGAFINHVWVAIPAAPDISATAGSCGAVPTSAAATGGATNVVVASAGNATSVATSGTAFNPLQGYWISDPLTLPGDPVTGSVIRWASNTPTGSSVTVETSINNGASWDAATNNRLVPRLKPGDTVTRGVLARISLTRTLATDPAPTVSYLEMQVSTDSGTDELVPIGYGMIDKVTTKTVGGSTGAGSTVSSVGSAAVTSKGGGQTGGGTSIKIHVTDMSRAIKRNVWQMPYVVPVGTNYGDAVKAMVLDRLPSQTEFAISTTTRATDSALVYGMDQGGDPWQDIREVAMAIGFEAYFDPRGVFVFRAVPDPRIGEPVLVFDENFNPIVAEATKELSDEQTFNDVVVTGQSSGTQNPVSAEAFDNDPASRTYILGDYGRVGQRLPFNNVTTLDQAQDAANAVLNNSLGAAETVTIVNVPHPALEPGDVVKIKVSNVKIDGTYIINSMTTPMSPAEAQQLVCFRQSTNA